LVPRSMALIWDALSLVWVASLSEPIRKFLLSAK